MVWEFQPLIRRYKPYLLNYLDDWIIATPDGEEGLALHWEITDAFLDLLQKLLYFLKLGKCEFEKNSIKFLGWLIMPNGITVDPAKAAGLADWPRQLHNVKELWHTLGILGYQRPFIRGYAQLAKPLIDLTWKEITFKWKEHHTEALDKLIHMVTTALVLGCPNLDQQFFVEVDTSTFALGVVLFQYDAQNKQRDVAYFSKVLTPPEWNYDIWDCEFLAIVAALRHWWHLLIGTKEPVVIFTNHANLQYYRK